MQTQRLINWIDTHYRPHPTIDNKDGTLIVFSEEVDAAGVVRVVCDVIPAELQAARDLLGY
ncbi:hypothetical protein [Burkholderia guangdongensis]|uniref:hypothetical protein n=1 Tax=Burkholderia guangdongensis TaxID=1792500 RepID=UPI0015CD983A|nr:hypothetical protein [Burkholderia guangdongensis]